MTWAERAECAKPEHRGLDWWPGRFDRIDHLTAICAACPVVAECLADGADDPWSVRGGLRPTDRGLDPRCGSIAGRSAHERAGTPLCAACRIAQAEASARSRAKRRARLEAAS